ncbi:hypothetical protein ASE04_14150 [Rhizobium sp. Root708]|uniref:hypothetical protein n=1 Tax=Rhizobium sp. Root708 TaxID=1736592 RepID=UPI0006F73F5C|nr:hypothetical protein [Rhizobium sp. Root708]KRB49753.1 hypothetical protein ASE04_14150 [Rhizobium sp. Root708]
MFQQEDITMLEYIAFSFLAERQFAASDRQTPAAEQAFYDTVGQSPPARLAAFLTSLRLRRRRRSSASGQECDSRHAAFLAK